MNKETEAYIGGVIDYICKKDREAEKAGIEAMRNRQNLLRQAEKIIDEELKENKQQRQM